MRETEAIRQFLADSLELGDRAAVSSYIQSDRWFKGGEYFFGLLRAAGRTVESLRGA